MQPAPVIRGNIFRSSCQTLVNTVNCVGVMGTGLAFECRLRYPVMFQQYAQLCADKKLDVGRLWIYKEDSRWVLNFPTKRDWKHPSKLEYLHLGLQKFMATYQGRGITSIAFPLLGAQNGGIDPVVALDLMQSYLKHCTIPVEIYQYDPQASDDLFDTFKQSLTAHSDVSLKTSVGLRSDALARLRRALDNPGICQMSQLLAIPGVGEKTLEKCFRLVTQDASVKAQAEQSLFDF